MGDEEQKIIFAKNLNRYISESGKSQVEIATTIGVSPQTFNTWCRGIAIPRMGKVQALADYFCISKADLIEPHSPLETDEHYYLNDETLQIAQEIFENPELYSLFRVARDLPSALLKAHIAFMESLKNQERGKDEDSPNE